MKFAFKELDLELNVYLDQDASLAELGDFATLVLAVLKETRMWGAYGLVTLRLTSAGEQVGVSFRPDSLESADQGLTGIKLLEALGYPTPTPGP